MWLNTYRGNSKRQVLHCNIEDLSLSKIVNGKLTIFPPNKNQKEQLIKLRQGKSYNEELLDVTDDGVFFRSNNNKTRILQNNIDDLLLRVISKDKVTLFPLKEVQKENLFDFIQGKSYDKKYLIFKHDKVFFRTHAGEDMQVVTGDDMQVVVLKSVANFENFKKLCNCYNDGFEPPTWVKKSLHV